MFFGMAFQDSIPIAKILLIAGFLYSIKRVFQEACRSMGFPEYTTYIEIIQYPFFVVLLPIIFLSNNIDSVARIVVLVHLLSLLVSIYFYLKALEYNKTNV